MASTDTDDDTSQLSLDELDETVTDGSTDMQTDTETGDDEVVDYIALASASERSRISDPVRAVLAAATDVTGTGLGPDDRSALTSEIVADSLDGTPPVAIRGGGLAWIIGDDRRAVDDALAAGDWNDVSLVVVDKLVTLGDSPGAIQARLDRALTAGARVLVLTEELDIVPSTATAATALNLLSGIDRSGVDLDSETGVDDLRARGVTVDDWHGRPPLGFTVEEGTLVPSADSPAYDFVTGVLELVDAGEISKGEAGRRLDTSRRTVTRALEERRDLYGLDE